MGEQPLDTNTMQQTPYTRQPRHANGAPARDFLTTSLLFAGLLTVVFVPTVVLGAVGGVVGFELLTRLREQMAPDTRTGHTASGSRPAA